MRIDLQYRPQEAHEPRPAAGINGTMSGSSIRGSLQEDQAVLSGAHATVAALVAQASQLPEVREDRVASLRQAIAAGEYRPGSEQVANSLMAHLLRRPVA